MMPSEREGVQSMEDAFTATIGPDPVEPAAPASPEPAAVTPEPEKPTDGRARNPDGTFAAKKDDLPETAPAAPVAAPETPPVSATEPTPAAPETPPDFSQYPKFSYSGPEGPVTLEHSYVGNNGILIGQEDVARVKELLGLGLRNRIEYGRAGERASRDVREAKDTLARAQAEKQAASTLLKQIHAVATDPAKLDAYAQDIAGNWARMQAEADKSLSVQRAEQAEARLAELQRERDDQARTSQIQSQTPLLLTRLIGQAQLSDVLTVEDRQTILGDLTGALFEAIYSEATQADVQAGLAQSVGEIMVNVPLIEREVQRVALIRQQQTQSVADAKAVAARNAATKAPSPAPPVVAAGVPAGKPKPPAVDYSKVDRKDRFRKITEDLFEDDALIASPR